MFFYRIIAWNIRTLDHSSCLATDSWSWILNKWRVVPWKDQLEPSTCAFEVHEFRRDPINIRTSHYICGCQFLIQKTSSQHFWNRLYIFSFGLCPQAHRVTPLRDLSVTPFTRLRSGNFSEGKMLYHLYTFLKNNHWVYQCCVLQTAQVRRLFRELHEYNLISYLWQVLLDPAQTFWLLTSKTRLRKQHNRLWILATNALG